jgi:chaperonin GroEL
MQNGFTPKELHFSDEGRTKLINGINKIANAVKSTLGPRGNTVLIESPEHLHGITVTKDGVTVAKSISLMDPVENLAVRMMKEAADRTATSAGDGTTTAIVLAEALVNAGTEIMDESVNRTEVLRHLVDETKSIAKHLKLKGKKLDQKRLRDVAVISANNDTAIGGIIAEVYESVGKDGVVTVENSKTSSTYYETTKGIKIKRGYASTLFINDQKRDECILEDTHVLVCDTEINNILQIENILKPIIQEGKKLLIIAPTSVNVTNTLAANVVKNGLKICTINPPDFGYRQHELMQDIAVSVGATYFSEKTGDDLSLINFSDLGHCSRVIVNRESTVIVKDDSNDESSEVVAERISQLQDAYKNAKVKADKEFINQRIASLSGGIGVVYVGGNTDLEQKELYDRVDDAVCAVRSALEEGILPGGGLTLYNMHKTYETKMNNEKNSAKKIAHAILSKALKAPLYQILDNAGLDADQVYKECKGAMWGYDVKKDKYGYLMSLGVIDPVKVTRQALQNAVSVAVTILSTNAIVTMARSYDSTE